MISTHMATERQGKDQGQNAGQIDGQTKNQIEGHELDHSQRSNGIFSSSSCDEVSRSGTNSVFNLPLDLQEYVRRVQREQQTLRSSRKSDKT